MDTPSVTCRDAGLGNRMGEAQGILDQGGSSAILDEETSEEDPKGGEETSHAGFQGDSFAEGRASGKAEHGRVHGGNAEEARSAGESRAWGAWGAWARS